MVKLYTPEEWQKYEEMFKMLETFSASFMTEFCHRDATLSNIEVCGGDLIINTETYFRSGSDYDSYNIPLTWLTEPDLMDRCRQRVEDNKRKAQEQKDEIECKRKAKQKQQDYIKFLAMKKEFE